MESSRFYSVVEGNRGWWKEYPHVTSKEVEYSRPYSAVESNKK